MFKKGLRLFAAIIVVVFMLSNMAFAAVSLSDITGHWAKNVLDKWADKGVVGGDPNGRFRPDDGITRAEFAVVMNNIFKYIDKSSTKFSDVPAGAWYADYVLKADKAGVMGGHNGAFRPDGKITREEAARVFVSAFNLTAQNANAANAYADAASIASWSKPFVSALYEKKYMTGKPGNKFDPKGNLTRAETLVIVDNILSDIKSVAGTYSGTFAKSLVVNVPNVVLKDVTIAGELYIAYGVGEGDVTLDNVKITGNLVANGGGAHSIVLNNTSVGKTLVVKKPNGEIRIVAKGETSVKQVDAESGGKLEEDGVTGEGFGEVLAELEPGQSLELDGSFTGVTVAAQGVSVAVTEGSAVGTVTVTEAAKDSTVTVTGGTVTQMNVNAQAKVDLKGGTVTNVAVAQTATNATVNVAGATVTNLDVAAKATVSMTSGTVQGVSVAQTATNATVSVAGATVTNLNVASQSTVSMTSGTVTSLTVAQTATNATVNVAGATVTNATVNAAATVQVQSGSVTNVNIGATATGANVAVSQGASVGTLVADAAVTVTGGSNIDNAKVNVNNTTFDSKPKAVDVATGVETKTGNETINDTNDNDTTQTPPPSGGGTPSGGDNPPAPTISISKVTLDINGTPKEGSLMNGTVTFDLSNVINYHDTDMLTSLKIYATPTDRTLSVEEVEYGGVTLQVQSYLGGVITFGVASSGSGYMELALNQVLDSGNNDISLGILRDVLASKAGYGTLKLSGKLKASNCPDVSVSLVINPGSGTDMFSRTKVGNSYNVTINTTTHPLINNTKLTAFPGGVLALYTSMFGTAPACISLDGTTWIDFTTGNKNTIAAAVTTEVDNGKPYGELTIGDLEGIKVYFKTFTGGTTVYDATLKLEP